MFQVPHLRHPPPIQRTPTPPLLSPISIVGTSPKTPFNILGTTPYFVAGSLPNSSYISGPSPKTPCNILGTTLYFIAGTSPNSSLYISGSSPKTHSNTSDTNPLQASTVLGTQPVISFNNSDISPIDSPSQHTLEAVFDTAFSFLETTSEASTQATSILDTDTEMALYIYFKGLTHHYDVMCICIYFKSLTHYG